MAEKKEKSIIAKRIIIRAIIYIVIFVLVLSFLWRFLLDESLFDVLMGK